MPTVGLLDANAIWSAAVRDTLLRSAQARLYRPLWTRQILAEMTRSLARQRPDLSPRAIERTVGLMQATFPAALIEDYEYLIPLMTNDPGDRHVLAAAVHGGADLIVTGNRKDFPATSLQPYSIQIQTPDEFLSTLWQQDPATILIVLQEQAAALRNPPTTLDDLLATLQRTVPQFADRVRGTELL